MKNKKIPKEIVEQWVELRKSPINMTHREIAEKYGVARDTVYKKLEELV